MWCFLDGDPEDGFLLESITERGKKTVFGISVFVHGIQNHANVSLRVILYVDVLAVHTIHPARHLGFRFDPRNH